MMQVQIDPGELHQRAADGLSATEIGRELGCDRRVVMRKAKALGIEVNGSQIPKVHSIERAVAEMNAREAVDYLLEIVKLIVPALDEDSVLRVCHYGFTATEAQILLMLFSGRFMSKETIYNAIYGNRPAESMPQPKVIDVTVCKIRKKIEAKGWGAEVKTAWGRGYYGERIDNFTFPWEVN